MVWGYGFAGMRFIFERRERVREAGGFGAGGAWIEQDKNVVLVGQKEFRMAMPWVLQ